MTQPTTKEIALSLAEQAGWYVFPVSRAGKPLVRWSTQATNDPAVIAGMFNRDERIGIHTGLSGLVVVDRDNKHGKNGFSSLSASGKPLPATFNYASRSGRGRHDVFAAPTDVECTIGTDVHGMAGVDIRAGVGMVVYNGGLLSHAPELAAAPAWTILPKQESHLPADLSTWLEEERSPRLNPEVLELIMAIPEHGASNGDLMQLITPIVSALWWGNGRNRGYKFSLKRYTKHYPTSKDAFTQAWSKAITRVEADMQAVLQAPVSKPKPGVTIHKDIVHVGREVGHPHMRVSSGGATLSSSEDVRVKSAEWVWGSEKQGGIPVGALTILTGKPGDGKSTMCRWLAARITTGTLSGTWAGTPHNVLYLHAEESLSHMVVPSMVANGADRKRVLLLNDDFDFTTSMDDLVNACLQADVKAVFVDPLTSYMTGVDTHRNSEVRDALKSWSYLAEAIDGAVIGIVHQTKSGGSDFVTGINGSSAFGEVARAVLATAVDQDDDTRVISQGKNSLGPLMDSREFTLEIVPVPVDGSSKSKHMPAFRLGGVTSRSAGEVFNRNKRLDKGDSQTSKTWLREYLDVNPGAFKEDILEAAKGLYAPRSLGRAAKELKVKSTFVDRKVQWALRQ